MENNIFENPYFGKPYKTRDGKKAIYLFPVGCGVYCITEEFKNKIRYFHFNGIPYDFEFSKYRGEDIISEWNEETNVDALINEAKNIAIEQKRISDHNKQKRIEELYNEVLSCLSYQIANKNIVGGIIKIRTSGIYEKYISPLDCGPYGYCNWNLGFVWESEGMKVAKLIQDKHHIDCQFVDGGVSADSYFKFNFNPKDE